MSTTTARPVRASDKVSEVLARDEQLVEVFVHHSPHFAKLRTPGMRRVMARLVTVEQAAHICGAKPSALVRELNHALGFDHDLASTETHGAPPRQSDTQHTMASHKPHDTDAGERHVPRVTNPWQQGAPIIELDVRDDLRKGHEPFSRIMAAVGALREGEALCLRATFEPVPLFAVMQKRGYDHFAERLDTDDWRIWFYPHNPEFDDEEDEASPSFAAPRDDTPSASASEIVLDVRGLEPPEPMQRTLEALTDLPEGAVLIQVNVRVPHFLLPILTERGFAYEIHEPNPERVVVRIWRASPDASTRESAGG
ncbi:MAG TPA: DUF2249 domain-containing protein [Gemmatimonadaceae bacterium]|nr:DUF2249 domain-containing protein [Gemmatimonadaceae bacterium]